MKTSISFGPRLVGVGFAKLLAVAEVTSSNNDKQFLFVSFLRV